MLDTNYNPDVLTCLANLSSDEVFTPPKLVNEILDLLSVDLWRDKNVTFLDPCCKSGVFLREIAKRLLEGLKDEIPELQERIDHIFQKQLFGIAITEMTSLLCRRSLYCSKFANGKYSISIFNSSSGNIHYQRIEHKWIDGRCAFCGASQEFYERSQELETHAYQFIHNETPEDFENMKFDVIIGNPPYQLSDGGDLSENSRTRGGATPIYQKFVQKAKSLNPKYLTMIIPSRWFAGGRGLNEFREGMLNDNHLRKLIDYPVSSECFPGVEIKGGVCYFLWEKDNPGLCEVKTIRGENKSIMTRPLLEENSNVFIRFNESIPILKKVKAKKEGSFSKLVSTQKPFGLRTYFRGKSTPFTGCLTLYTNDEINFIEKEIIVQNSGWVNSHKVFISMAYGAGEDFPHQIINKPFYGGPLTCCTETYLVIGPFESKQIAENVISYIETKFFRFLVLLRKNTQHAAQGVYSFVPIQDFSTNWSDEKLYKKYDISDEEKFFIESLVRPMGFHNENKDA